MTGGNENRDEGRDAGRTSGATRRIIVQDAPPEDKPRARGRKMETPVDIETTSRPSMAGGESVWEHQRPTHLTRPTVSQNTKRSVPTEIRGNLRQPGGAANVRQKDASGPSRGQINVKKLMVIIGGIVALPFVLTGVLFLLPSPGNKKIARESQPAISAPSPISGSPTPEASASIQSSPEMSTAVPQSGLEVSPNAVASASVESSEIQSMSVQLASQISQKSGYEFAPEFVAFIRTRTQEYNSQAALNGARQYRREINKSFRDQGLNPLVGYALAMSRSKFDPAITEKGVGIWQIPPGVTHSLGYVGSLKIPEASAQITASYTKQLLSVFDPQDFMYAIACFGMSPHEAGRLQARLVIAAPDTKSRRDIMKMIRANVLTAEQVDNIARFFAAGIVGENPQRFGLNDSQPFSSLY